MKPLSNNLTKILKVDYPIIQAPMGWIARYQLACAVSEAGGLGIIETSSGELEQIRKEICQKVEFFESFLSIFKNLKVYFKKLRKSQKTLGKNSKLKEKTQNSRKKTQCLGGLPLS